MQFCLWDYVTCLVVVALVSYRLIGDLSDILDVVHKCLLFKVLVILRPNKKISVFRVTGLKILG